MKSKKNIKSILVMAALGIVSLFFINMSLAANTAKINVETANLREKADENSKILEQFSINEEVEIIEKQGEWYKVKAKGMTGYLRQDLLKIENDGQQAENKTQDQASQENSTQEDVNQENNTTKEVVNEEIIDTNEETENSKQKIAEDTKLKIVPVINATDIIEVKKDEEVTIIEKVNDWVCVEVRNTKGWIRKEKLQSEDKTEKTETAEQNSTQTTVKTLYTNSETVNLRKEANTNSEILVALTVNTSVEVISEQDGWSKVKASGKEGYISSSLLSAQKQETSRSMTTTRKNTENQKTTTSKSTTKSTTATTTATTPVATTSSGKGSSVVAAANQYIGSRYVYGGTTPSGFDCSGFTSYVYRKFGVNLNRTAAGQYSNGVAVSRSQLQPGDLVMFGKSGINHVGIYAGGGKIVHAANSSRGVTTDSINSGYYNKNYVGARRILQ